MLFYLLLVVFIGIVIVTHSDKRHESERIHADYVLTSTGNFERIIDAVLCHKDGPRK